jgi:hypothetical protein
MGLRDTQVHARSERANPAWVHTLLHNCCMDLILATLSITAQLVT